MLIHFRDSLEALNQVELALAQTRLYDFLELRHSYVSVVELGLYESTRKTYEAAAAKGFEAHTPEWNAEMRIGAGAGERTRWRRGCYPAFPTRSIFAFIRWTASAASR